MDRNTWAEIVKIANGFSLAEIDRSTKPDWSSTNVYIGRLGGLGDAISLTVPAKIGHELGPNVHICGDLYWTPVYENNPHIESVVKVVDAGAYCYLNNIYNPGVDAYDSLFDAFALPRQSSYKPEIYLTASELDDQIYWFERNGLEICLDGYAVLQPASKGSLKTMPLFLLERCLQALQPRTVVVVHNEKFKPETKALIKKYAGHIVIPPDMRSFFCLIAQADLVVACDSSAPHIAACFDVPTVVVWSVMDPRQIATYYTKQINIYHQSRCSLSPCRWTHPAVNYPPFCPAEASASTCLCYDDIETDEIKSAIDLALQLQ